jgi:membrane protein
VHPLHALRTLRGAWPELLEGFHRNDLLTYASAMSFQAVVALAPLTLTILAVLGFLGAGEIWSSDVAPELRSSVSPAAFEVIDSTATRVLGERAVVWLTGGVLVSTWYVSSVIRATMGALDGVYGCGERRTLGNRLRVSLSLAWFGPLLVDAVGEGAVVQVGGFLLRWLVAIALLVLGVSLLVRHAPATPQPGGWVTVGAGLAITAWIAMSAVFTLYVTKVADYGSLYGALASFVVLFSYLFFSAVALLVGVQLDAILRRAATGTDHGDPQGASADGGGSGSDSAKARASA